MATYTERYEAVTFPAAKNLRCPGECGKKVRRQKTFQQTISPFNRNAEGQVKTRPEIFAELRAQAEEWQQKPELCTPCGDWDVTGDEGPPV
jgi:hypothetical protein